MVAVKTTARKYSPRTLRLLSATPFSAAVVFVRSILLLCSRNIDENGLLIKITPILALVLYLLFPVHLLQNLLCCYAIFTIRSFVALFIQIPAISILTDFSTVLLAMQVKSPLYDMPGEFRVKIDIRI